MVLSKLSFFLLVPLALVVPMTAYAISVEPHHTTAYIGAPGEADILLSYSMYSTDRFWNAHGKQLPTHNDFTSHAVLLYGEYALNECNSFTFNGGYSMVNESLNGDMWAFEDAEIGWKHLLLGGETSALTGQLIVIVPAGHPRPSVRYGQFGIQYSFLYSDTFDLYDRCGWYDVDIGYRWYQGFPSDQVIANAAVGYDLTSRIQMILSGEFDCGIFNGDDDKHPNNIILNPNYRLLQAKLECVVRVFRQMSISVGGYRHLWGQNVGVGGGYFCGAWLDF